MIEKRTDLAIEIRESFPEDDVEIEGVILKERYFDNKRIKVSTVIIKNAQGAKRMGKPVGRYVTIEFNKDELFLSEDERDKESQKVQKLIADVLHDMEKCIAKKCNKDNINNIMVTGLGNRFATPDALGPVVMENIQVNRHIISEYGMDLSGDNKKTVCGISPGVMSQTGIETSEILNGLVRDIRPDCLIVIDALASRSISRLCRTIQITDTGISPGAGIGNNRNKVSEDTINVPVIAIGVPTVVDAGTIVRECMENSLSRQGFSEEEIYTFLNSITENEYNNLFVTPKDIDEKIAEIGKCVADGMNYFFSL